MEDESATNQQSSQEKEMLAILELLGMEELLPKFRKEEINDEVLKQLNLDDKIEWEYIASLIPKIGQNLKFRHAIAELQKKSGGAMADKISSSEPDSQWVLPSEDVDNENKLSIYKTCLYGEMVCIKTRLPILLFSIAS